MRSDDDMVWGKGDRGGCGWGEGRKMRERGRKWASRAKSSAISARHDVVLCLPSFPLISPYFLPRFGS